MGKWVELRGRAQPLQALHAPLSGAPCVLYRVELCLWQRLREGWAGRGGGSSELAGACFALRVRGAPELLVDPRQAAIELRGSTLRRRIRRGEDAALDARLRALYARLGRDGTPPATVVCRERWLGCDEEVEVCGELIAVPAADGAPDGYREPPRRALLRAASITP